MIEAGTYPFFRATLALCLGSLMVFANLYAPQPLLPTLAHQLDLSTLQSGWILSIATLTLGASLLFYGPLSDARGRKALMLLSMAGVVLTTLLLSHADSYATILLLRALQGLMLGGLPAIAIAYMGEEFSPKALMLAVGFYIAANSLGGIAGRLMGGIIGDHLGWSSTFVFIGSFNLLMLILFWLLLPASQRFRPRRLRLAKVRSHLVQHLQNPTLLPAYLIGGLNFFIFINQYSYATFMLADAPYSLSSSLLGALFLTYLAGTLSSAMSGKVAQFLPQPMGMASGIALMIVGSLITLLATLPAIVGGFLLSAFGFFFCHSTASSWISRHARFSRASASSLYLVFYYLGASLGGPYLDPFWRSYGWNGVIGASLLILLFTLGTALRLSRQQYQPQATEALSSAEAP